MSRLESKYVGHTQSITFNIHEDMPETTPTPIPTAPPTTKTPSVRAEQDQRIANAITEAGQIIEMIRKNAELSAALEPRGYDAAKLTEGNSLQTAAQRAYAARQSAPAAQRDRSNDLQRVEDRARRSYTDFRETVRAVYPQATDRGALGLSGKVPVDVQKFITAARASYAAAETSPQAAELSKFGWPQARLDAALEELDGLSAAESSFKAAQGAAMQARADRDAAFAALAGWVKQFRRIAKLALRDQPGLSRMVNL